MAWNITIDERTLGVSGQNIPSGHPQADASNLINNNHTLANYSIAYGTLVDDYFTPDVDVYSLGELYQGLYVVDVDDFTWDDSNIDLGSVSNFAVLDSFGIPIETSYSTFTDITFAVNSPSTYYLEITGPYISEAQYSAYYNQILSNNNAIGSSPIILQSVVDGMYTVGETVSADLLIIDADGYNSADLITSWYVNKNGVETFLSYGNEIVIPDIAEGGNIGFNVSFYDLNGFFEYLGPYYSPEAVQPAITSNAQGDNPVITQSLIDGKYSVGETVTGELSITDPNGYNLSDVTTTWFLNKNNVETTLGTGDQLIIPSSAEGGTIGFSKSFVDAQGNQETLGPYFTSTPVTSEIQITKTNISLSDYSNDYDVQVLLESDPFQYKWGGDLGNASNLTYSFSNHDTFILDQSYSDSINTYTSLSDAGYTAETIFSNPEYHFKNFTDTSKDVIRDAFDKWSDGTGVEFIEIDETTGNYGDIRLFVQNFSTWSSIDSIYDSSAGFSYMPGIDTEYDALDGDVFLDETYISDLNFLSHLIMHELGHSLGLAHPHDGYLAITGDDPSIYNDPNDIKEYQTVMSYDQTYKLSDGLMPLDIKAAEYLYGGNSNANFDDDNYLYNQSDLIFRQSIIDKGGEDTLDFSALNQGTYVNLSPNTWSSMQFTGDEAQFSSENNWVYQKGDLYISEHTEIENVVGTNSNDIILDNNLTNNINAGGGFDIIYHYGNYDIIDGGDDTDTLYLVNKSFSDINDITTNTGNYVIHFQDYDLAISNIENIYDNSATSRVFSELVSEYINSSPIITSPVTSSIDENSSLETVIYKVEATDPEYDTITYLLGAGGDAHLLSIDSDDGEVRLSTSADYEAKPSYTFEVIASDGDLSSSQSVTINVNDIQESLEVNLVNSGFDALLDQNFIELSVSGNFADNETLMLGFENPLVDEPSNGIGESSIFNTISLNHENRIDKFYFDKHINSIDVNAAFLLKDGVTTSLNENEINELINFENISLDVPSPDLNYGTIVSSLDFKYDNEVPTGLDLSVTFSDNISGLAFASIYFAEKVDGFYEFSDSSLNYNFTYFDDLTLSSEESISLTFSDLSTILATTNVAIHDRAGNFISFDRSNQTPYMEVVNLDNISLNSFSETTIQPMIFVSQDFNYNSFINGSVFDDYLVLPGHYDQYSFFDIDNKINVVKGEYNIETSSIEKFVFSNGSYDVNQLQISSINQKPTITSPVTSSIDENSPLETVIYKVEATDPEYDTITYLLGAGGDAHLLSIDSDDGEVRLSTSADYEAKPSYTFEVIASDGDLSSSQSVTININDLNEDPVTPPSPPEPEEPPTDPLTVSVSDAGWNLYKDVLSDQFDPSYWTSIFGSSLSDNINRLINAQNLELSDRWASAEINPLDYLSSQLSVFNDTQSLQDDLSARFGSIIQSNTDLTIQSNGLTITDPDNNVSLALTADNLSGDLFQIMSNYNNGMPITDILASSLSGQLNALTLVDGTSGGTNTDYTVSLTFENSDGDANDAEALILDISGTALRIEGSFPRDIASVFDLVNNEPWIPLIDKLQNAGHDITGIKLLSDGQEFISVGTDGIFIEARYDVAGDTGITASQQRAVQFDLDISLADFSSLNGIMNHIKVSDVIIDPSQTIVEEEVSIKTTPTAWSVSVADLEIVAEGQLTNNLTDLETNEGNYTIDKLSLKAGESGSRQDLIVAEQPTTLPAEFSDLTGDDAILDLRDIQGPVEFYTDDHAIGTNYNDIIITDSADVIISGGDGDDIIGFTQNWPDGYINPDFGKFYGGSGSDTFYMGLTSYGHSVSLPDFNPAEDNIILSPSNVGRGLTGYEIYGNELTLTYHNTSYPGNESKIILPDGLNVTAVQNAIKIDDPLSDWMETYLTITHKDEYEQNWQYDGYQTSDANVIYDTRWDDYIKGSDIDQDIYLTYGSDIIDGAGGSDTVYIDESFSGVNINSFHDNNHLIKNANFDLSSSPRMDRMDITSAQYYTDPISGTIAGIRVIKDSYMDGLVSYVPLNPDNRDYAEILKQVEEGMLIALEKTNIIIDDDQITLSNVEYIQFNDTLVDLTTRLNNSPTITSPVISSIDENSPLETVIYKVEATDPEYDTITYLLGAGGDAHLLSIDSDDGEVRLSTSADYETKPSYTFEVIASDGDLSSSQSVTINVNDLDEDTQGTGTYWKIEDNDLHWFDLGKGLDITIDQSDFQSASVTYYSGGGNSGIQWNDGIQIPAQVNFETLSDGNMVATWAVDIWKDLGGGSWDSDTDLFYRIFDPADGTFITDEIRITDNTDSESIEEIQTFNDGSFEIQYTTNGQTHFYNSSGNAVGAYWKIEDNDLHWFDLGKGLDITIDQSDFQSASVTYYSGGGNSGIQWNDGIQIPAQVNFETLSDGNMVATWAVDIWKDLGGGSWDSDTDLFYRIFDPADGTFITDEIRITDNTDSESIEEIQTFNDGSFEIQYTTNGQGRFYNSLNDSIETYLEINVNTSSDVSGLYDGGHGFDELALITDQNATNGVVVDFSAVNQDVSNSAFIIPYDTSPSNVAFEINNWEKLSLTNNSDYAIITDNVGIDITDIYDANYFTTSQSVLTIDPGQSGDGVDRLDVLDKDSQIHLSYDSLNFSTGISVSVTETKAAVTGNDVNTLVNGFSGNGQVIDRLTTTNLADTVTNNSTLGMVVDLGGSTNAGTDTFTGSYDPDAIDVLDARDAYNLDFSVPSELANYDVRVLGTNQSNEQKLKAELKQIDMIMVRDVAAYGITDIDFYVDLMDIYGADSQQIEGFGSGSSDVYGEGYDVQTSAKVNIFGSETDLRVYYDGKHTDFIDTGEIIDTTLQGQWKMVEGNASNGADWEQQVEASNPSGGEGSFFIVVGGKKISVTYVDGEWKADNTSLSIAQGVTTGNSGGIGDSIGTDSEGADSGAVTITTNFGTMSEQQFIASLVDRYGLPDLTDPNNYSYSNAIYLNATSQQINEVLGGDGSLNSEKAFNFGFYTKVNIGDAVINLKLSQSDTNPQKFNLNWDDVDLIVETFYNRVETVGAGVSAGGEAANFVKVDNNQDIVMGNGGNDTYVIGSNDDGGKVAGGTAFEYGDISSEGGLINSEGDSVNFADIDSITELDFVRGRDRNERADSSLFISEDGGGNATVLFDNFNLYLDFRRIEFLTIDDAGNNNKIFEISVDGNGGTDDFGKDLAWDNEIVVANNQGDTIYADGGTDVLVGGQGSDTFDLSNVLDGSTVYIENFTANDNTILKEGSSTTSNTNTSDGVIYVSANNGTESYYIYTDANDEQLVLDNLILAGS